jgi:hypothetical protein
VPGAHTDDIVMTKANSESGFATLEALRGAIHKIAVPPGHIVLFFQRIRHIVNPSRRKTDSYRQFRCWRLFCTAEGDPEPLNGSHETAAAIRDFGVPRLPSRQIPPLYGSNHMSAFLFRGDRNDPIAWSAARFPPFLSENRVCSSGKNRHRSYRIVPRYLPSLRAFDLHEHYPAYTDAETAVVMPSRRWELPAPESVQDILELSLLDRRRTPYKTIVFS